MDDIRATSKARRQSEIADYIGVLSYMVKNYDSNGVDLFYFNSRKKIERCKESSRLADSVRQKRFSGLSNPEGTLKTLLRRYLAKLKTYQLKLREYDEGRRRSFLAIAGRPEPPKPLSIYVLTDGVWESPDTTGGGYLEDTLREMIEVLRATRCGRDQVGIQFIRFGSHEHGVQRLEALDRFSATHQMGL
jgi:hypothetical protein